MQRIQFGEAESLGKVALRGGIGGSFTFVAPRFGTTCVCCNGDAKGRTQDFDASTDRVQAPAVPMPVCEACKDHALQSTFASIMQVCLLFMGLGAIGLAIMYLRQRPHDDFLWGTGAVGVALFAVAVTWMIATARRTRRATEAGHHPALAFSIAHGRTLLDTRNDQLADELLARNPNARRLPTPLLWREARRVPAARVVPSAPRDDKPPTAEPTVLDRDRDRD